MEQDILNEPLVKERSYVKSISTGIRLTLRHPWGFLRHLWPLLLLNAIVWAVTSGCLSSCLWNFYTEATAVNVAPSSLITGSFLTCAAWGLLATIMLGVWIGQIVYLMRRYAELTYLPAVKPWKVWRDILPSVLRGITVSVLGYLVVAALAVLALFAMPGRMWAFLLFLFLAFVWLLLFVPMAQHYLMEDRSLISALAWPFKNFTRLGGSSAILVVCGLLVLTVLLVAFIPSVCAIYVGGLSDISVAIGDGTDIPSSFALLRSLSFALTFVLAPIAWTFLIVPLCFHWGSEEAIRKSYIDNTNKDA